MHYTWHHIHSLWQEPLVFMTSHALYSWHHMHYIWHVIYYVWYLIQYTCDILSTIFMTSYPLCMTTLCVVDTTLGISVTSFALLMISHPLYHTKRQFLWGPIHFRHDITPTVSDTTPYVSLSSQPHFVITYPLFYDIIPTLCVTPYALHITSYQVLMSSLYCTYNIAPSIYETSSTM